MAFSKYTMTNAGRELQLDCMASGDFQIHSLVLGSGSYSGIMNEIEDVVEPVMTFSGESLTVVRRNEQIEVRVRLTNEQLEQGFLWREYGVYATDGERTVLYCYDNAGEEPVPVSSAASGAVYSSTIKVILGVSRAATVNVEFQPDPDIVIDDTVTETGENAVSGAAVWAFAKAENIRAGAFPAGMLASTAADPAKMVPQIMNIMLGTADIEDVLDQIPPNTIYFTTKAVE